MTSAASNSSLNRSLRTAGASFAAFGFAVLVTFAGTAAHGQETTSSRSSSSWWGSGERVTGSGKMVDVQRNVSGFNRVFAGGSMNVVMRKTNGAEKVTVRADDNIEPLIETEVSGGTLNIRTKPNTSYRTRERITVTVEYKQVDTVRSAGSGNFTIDQVSGDQFDYKASGSGNLLLENASVRQLELSISGSGNIEVLQGTASNQSISIAGSGNVVTRGLSGQSLRISIAGSGDVRVGRVEQLEASISGSGNIDYLGQPKVTQRISGSGRIRSN